jgi:hypothetical protein
MKIQKKLLLLSFGMALSACSVTSIKKYNPNFKTTREVEKLKSSVSEVDVLPSQEKSNILNQTSLSCRATTFQLPTGMTLKNYLQEALTDELDAAHKLQSNGSILKVVVHELNSDTAGFNTGTWSLDFEYFVGKNRTRIRSNTAFESAFMGDTACRNTATALEEAVRENFSAYFQKITN